VATSEVLAVLHRVASAVRDRLDHLDNWGRASGHEGQYVHDVAADEVAVSMLGEAGFGVLSEESGFHGRDRPVLVVVDPVDGSTNASRGLPWWGTSLCALDDSGPLAAVVVNQVTGTRYEAARGGGARRDGKQVRPSGCNEIGKAVLAFSGYPPSHLGWAQFRALGASALELCAVADGTVDGFVDWAASSLRPWDYLGALLVCAEAGAPFTEASGRDLVVTGTDVHRAPVAAATPSLLDQLARAREGRPAAVDSGEAASENRGQQKII
jgi:myo-inositol-1(or 4)-monophosphatase